MAEKINDGGPVFPHEFKYGDGSAQRCEGMTLRDYFAAKAMQSYLLDKDVASFTFEQWAQASYEMADAMLKTRGQQ